MPLEKFVGPDVPTLLARAQAMFGAEAVLVSIRRLTREPGAGFEVIAADPASAAASVQAHAGWRPARGLTAMTPLIPAQSRWEKTSGGAHRVSGVGDPMIVALVGPTGAGKTTTIAKLANHPRVFGGRAVGLLCLDTYRIGAVEQSRIYAELSRLPIEVVYEPSELEGALGRLADREVILVDTAGRGPNAGADAAATRRMLRELEPAEVHLTLPAGLDRRMAERVIARHRPYGLTHLIATKLDEFPEDRSAFELAAEHRLAMRWLTDGQEVPRDLRPATDTAPSGAAGSEHALAGTP